MPQPGEWMRDCPHCSAVRAAFAPQGSFTTNGPFGNQRHWGAASCPVCGGIIVAEVNGNDHIANVVPEHTGDWPIEHLTSSVLVVWEEAVKVFKVGAFAAAVVACGRTLEAAALDLNVIGKTLQQRIQRMLDEGMVTARFKEAMDYVRLIRNVGAHAGKPVSPESAEGTMRFTQQTLRLLYEVPGELARLTSHPPELNGDDHEVQ